MTLGATWWVTKTTLVRLTYVTTFDVILNQILGMITIMCKATLYQRRWTCLAYISIQNLNKVPCVTFLSVRIFQKCVCHPKERTFLSVEVAYHLQVPWCAMLFEVASIAHHVTTNILYHLFWLPLNDCKVIHVAQWWIIWIALKSNVSCTKEFRGNE